MNLTRWIIVAATLLILGVDVGLALVYGVNATISVQMTKWSHEYPIIAVLWGVLIGHFFTQNQKGIAP